MAVHCFTSFTFSYLARAKILVQTLRQAHPDWTIWAVMVDEPSRERLWAERRIRQRRLCQGPRFRDFESWLFKHDIVEASTAVKGKMCAHLLQRAPKRSSISIPISPCSPISRHRERLDSIRSS